MAKQTKVLQAEIKELLDLMVHSLYSKREVFLRELISNSSDALDKLRLEEISNPELVKEGAEKHIRLHINQDTKTLTLSDNGIGMSESEIIENIGTIAHSGTRAFMEKAKKAKKDDPELIGQFGIGFYSAFMVANHVSVTTLKAGEQQAYAWECDGSGEYTLEKTERPEGHGTTITLQMKEFTEEECDQNFLDEWTLKSIVRRYSDFISFPIYMETKKEVPVKDEKGEIVEGKTTEEVQDETLNSQKALWLRPSSEIEKDEYNDFYRHMTHDWNEPGDIIHYKAEGTQEFAALLFIPSQLPMDYNQRQQKWGLSLYVKRVFIKENAEELIPQYLRFVKGLVDSHDLPLNVSRELLQTDRQIRAINKAVTGKVLRTLETKLKKERESYEKFWAVFGSTMKEGIASDHGNKEKLQSLCLFQSSNNDSLTTLKEYSERMKEGQKAIYYICGESLSQLKSSPYLEKLTQKGYEVLFLTDPVDEWVVSHMDKFQEVELKSITAENLDLDSEDDKKEQEEQLKSHEETYSSLKTKMTEDLTEKISEVRLSNRLIDSPVCLVAGNNHISARMEKMLKNIGENVPQNKRILEINPNHPVILNMKNLDDSRRQEWSQILYSQALLNEGSEIENPGQFSQQISKLMIDASASAQA
ncbi:MAG: molecular chaperone HtpG [Oligoflexales bacterium]